MATIDIKTPPQNTGKNTAPAKTPASPSVMNQPKGKTPPILWIIIVVIIVVLGGIITYNFINQPKAPVVNNVNNQGAPIAPNGQVQPGSNQVAPQNPNVAQNYNIFGKIVSVNGNSVVFAEMTPPAKAGEKPVATNKTYTATVSGETKIILQTADTLKDGSKSWKPTDAKATDIKKDYFLSVRTSQDPTKNTSINALQIDFSVASPF